MFRKCRKWNRDSTSECGTTSGNKTCAISFQVANQSANDDPSYSTGTSFPGSQNTRKISILSLSKKNQNKMNQRVDDCQLANASSRLIDMVKTFHERFVALPFTPCVYRRGGGGGSSDGTGTVAVRFDQCLSFFSLSTYLPANSGFEKGTAILGIHSRWQDLTVSHCFIVEWRDHATV